MSSWGQSVLLSCYQWFHAVCQRIILICSCNGSDFSFINISFWKFSLFCGFAQLCCCSIPICYWYTVKLPESTASLVAWFAWICPLKQYPPSECLNVGFSQHHLVAVSVWNVAHRMKDCIEYLWILFMTIIYFFSFFFYKLVLFVESLLILKPEGHDTVASTAAALNGSDVYFDHVFENGRLPSGRIIRCGTCGWILKQFQFLPSVFIIIIFKDACLVHFALTLASKSLNFLK